MPSSLTNGLVVPGHYFPIAYAIIVGLGLVMSLVMGMRLHFTEIVKTHCKTAEYWPSISATTGDFAPERFIWRTAFVLCALFRFTTGFLTFKFFSQQEAQVAVRASSVVSTRGLVLWEFACELLRCASAIGWTIISSGEDNLHHNASFAVYMIVGFVLQATQVVIVDRLRGTYSGSNSSLSLKKKCLIGQSLMAMCVGFFYTRHHQTCAPGAYSRSTMCEWAFAFFNILFDASQAYELVNERVSFGSADLNGATSSGEPHYLKLASAPSNAVMWISEVFLSYFLVSTTIQLVQAVYFVPMVAMRFTWEVSLLIGFTSPLLLFNNAIRHFLTTKRLFGAQMYVYCYMVAILSLFSYDARSIDPGTKIVVVSIGAIFAFLGYFLKLLDFAAASSSTHAADQGPTLSSWRDRMVLSLPMGFALSMMMRMFYTSADPLYTSPAYNCFIGLLFGEFCVACQYRWSAYGVKSGNVHATDAVERGDRTPPQHQLICPPSPSISPVTMFCGSTVQLGVAFGSVLCISFIMVSSPNFIARLVAVDPWPTSLSVIVVFLAGLYMSPQCTSLNTLKHHNSPQSILVSPIVTTFAFFGYILLCFGTRQSNRTYENPRHAGYPTTQDTPRNSIDIHDWITETNFAGNKEIAYMGGLMVIFAIGAIWPIMMEYFVGWFVARVHRKSFGSIGSSVELWFPLTMIFGFMMQVYIVCYPFVPLGFLLRDRMDFALALTLAVAVISTLRLYTRQPEFRCRVVNATSHVYLVLLGLTLCLAVGREIGSPESRSVEFGQTTLRDNLPAVADTSKKLIELMFQQNALEDPRLPESARVGGLLKVDEGREKLRTSVMSRFGSSATAVWSAAQHLAPITAMIWTIHTGIADFNTDAMDRMTEMMRATGAGIIGLLESDAVRIHNGNRDVVEYFATKLGYEHTDYGPTTYDGTFGCALITKYPIIAVKRYVLPSPLGELACLIHAKLDLMGVEMQVYVGHWGNTEHWADGILQSQYLGELVQHNPGPSVFLGYLVTKPGEGNYKFYTSETEPGKFRDTALQLYKKHPWKRLTQLGGYVEEVNEEDKKLPLVDQQYHRPPVEEQPRYFQFEDTERYSTAHPRWEYVDRYCQYILYKSGLAKDEKPEDANKLQPYYFELVDWWRVLEIHNISDTEIQVVQLAVKPNV